ncbi:unnamed protein product [Meloidogyne enterolobii]|uniref:Uncharacterized protein n=1 Tax=Meloidogyne enterolobii TaxID=390850 RepID=A0ACB1AE05_MELEN
MSNKQQIQNIGSSNDKTNQKIIDNIVQHDPSAIVQLTDEEKKKVAIFESAHVYTALLLNVDVKKVSD